MYWITGSCYRTCTVRTLESRCGSFHPDIPKPHLSPSTRRPPLIRGQVLRFPFTSRALHLPLSSPYPLCTKTNGTRSDSSGIIAFIAHGITSAFQSRLIRSPPLGTLPRATNGHDRCSSRPGVMPGAELFLRAKQLLSHRITLKWKKNR